MDSTMYFLSEDDKCSNLMPVESVMSTSCGSCVGGGALGTCWPRSLTDRPSKAKNAASTPRKPGPVNTRTGGRLVRITRGERAARTSPAFLLVAPDPIFLFPSICGTSPSLVEHGRAGSNARSAGPPGSEYQENWAPVQPPGPGVPAP